MNKMIGGFFELETGQSGSPYHQNATLLTSGRSCLHLILSIIKPAKVYVPYYLCNAALIPFTLQQIQYSFYAINHLLFPEEIILNDNEYILYVNYFGLMNDHLDKLYERYGNRLIVDNTHAFFERNYKDCWSFNSARKYFGVADGAYLYGPTSIPRIARRNESIQTAHLYERLQHQEHAYQSYLKSEENISSEILGISAFSEKILANIDYTSTIQQRQANFATYAKSLSHLNLLTISQHSGQIPFCYPLWIADDIQHSSLSAQNIFIPCLWRDTITRVANDYQFEKNLSNQLLPLPIDHRYSAADCERVIQALSSLLPATLES